MFPERETVTPGDEILQRPSLRVLGWFSLGMAVAALSIYAGVELRSRYKFRHRTPYDFYAAAGESQTAEFGVGI